MLNQQTAAEQLHMHMLQQPQPAEHHHHNIDLLPPHKDAKPNCFATTPSTITHAMQATL
jgi:hypothetical protein